MKERDLRLIFKATIYFPFFFQKWHLILGNIYQNSLFVKLKCIYKPD